MHELSISRNIVEIATEHAQGQAIARIRLAVGELSCVMPEALHFCFDAVRRDTVLANAQLDIERVAGRARCQDCGAEFALPVGGARCSCGAIRHEILQGEELKIVEIEFDQE